MKTRKLTSNKWLGIVFGILAIAMLITELVWRPVFTLQLTEDISLPVWILVAIYSALQLYLWIATKRKFHLTEAELNKWGPKLEEVTPKILDRYEQRKSLKEIATEIEQTDGIPPDVTLRYIIALAQHARNPGAAEG